MFLTLTKFSGHVPRFSSFFFDFSKKQWGWAIESLSGIRVNKASFPGSLKVYGKPLDFKTSLDFKTRHDTKPHDRHSFLKTETRFIDRETSLVSQKSRLV